VVVASLVRQGLLISRCQIEGASSSVSWGIFLGSVPDSWMGSMVLKVFERVLERFSCFGAFKLKWLILINILRKWTQMRILTVLLASGHGF
ncbi:hypothetical protein HAX54_026427, partial [Datura stramonium]|nr:hypothetical protein [Datura stramonium]